MSSIQNLFQQAQLAEAAYADFSNPDVQKALTNAGFSSAQAVEFVAHWRVIDQYDNSTGLIGLFGTGFSATLFQNTTIGVRVI